MTLRASRLHQLDDPNLSVNTRAELCCEIVRDFENKGEYEEAQKVLSGYWQHIDERPEVGKLEPRVAAEVLLRAGVLTGFIGSKHQLAEGQERAKDLIFESLSIFQSLNQEEKITEAQTELALCYWRTGENNEARDLLQEALSRLIVDNDVKGKAVVRLAIVETVASECEKALSILTDYASLFQKLDNQTLKGAYHATLGNVLKNLWETETRTEYLDRALVEYAAASYHFELAEHRNYLANVQNNLGILYFAINRFEEAHQHLDHARRLLDSLEDVTGVAQVDESRACVFLKQGQVVEAERIVRSAVHTQEQSGRTALLAEALITHGRALARLENYSEALSAFRRAIQLSEHTGDRNRAAEAAFAVFQEMGQHLAIFEGEKFVSGRTLNEEVSSFEHDTLKVALENSQGSVTRAARSLGMSHQALTYILESRHNDLLKYMKPQRRRPRRYKN
jgi:tetratricopeptide (TPR) repeat protein